MSPAKTARAAFATLLCAAGAVIGVPAAAFACTPPTGGVCGDSTVNVVLTAGTLALSVPASVSISGTLGAGSSFATTMGTIQVQDNRGSLAGWTLSALTSGDLTTGGTSPQTISLGTSTLGGPLVLAPGSITAVGGASLVGVTSGTAGSLNPSQPLTLARALPLGGAGTYTMTPTLTFTPPANVVAGTYTTTIAYSLS
jgi:hypothetical protein